MTNKYKTKIKTGTKKTNKTNMENGRNVNIIRDKRKSYVNTSQDRCKCITTLYQTRIAKITYAL